MLQPVGLKQRIVRHRFPQIETGCSGLDTSVDYIDDYVNSLPAPRLPAIAPAMDGETEANAKGWRGSEDLWIDAAYALLVESGVKSVKVMTVAKALGLSRTSFYWHFPDRDALLDALIRRWRERNTANLVAQTELYAASITEAVLNLFDCWIKPRSLRRAARIRYPKLGSGRVRSETDRGENRRGSDRSDPRDVRASRKW